MKPSTISSTSPHMSSLHQPSTSNNQSHDQHINPTEMRAICTDVLSKNTRIHPINGQDYKRTIPSPEFYVHAWNWDSATVALGLVTTSPERALSELVSLTAAQWPDGMIPHINYHPDENRYYPKQENWKTTEQCSSGTHTSGISQPPVIGLSTPVIATAILQKTLETNEQLTTKQQQDLKSLIEGTLHFLHYIKHVRDSENSGLVTVVHPWESGLDNAPTWDEPLKASEFKIDDISEDVKNDVMENRKDINPNNISQRPEQAKYYYYMHLVDQGNQLNWDYDKIVEQSYFQVKDVLFTSTFAASCDQMADFLESNAFQSANLDITPPDPKTQDLQSFIQTLRNWGDRSREGLQHTWDDSISGFLCQDKRQSSTESTTGYKPIHVDSISKFMPLLAKAATTEQVKTLVQDLQNPESYGTENPTPTTPLNAHNEEGQPLFEMERYWRGPTWPITNLLLIEGLKNYVDEIPETHKVIETLTNSTTRLAETIGLQEYYHPTDAEAVKKNKIGYGNFSWTAAIYLHLTAQAQT